MRNAVKRFIDAHKLVVLVVSVILVACALVSISMTLYYRSDAYRIDLSRPEFKDSRSQIVNSEKQETDFPASGAITPDVLKDFYKRYDELSKRAFDSKAFSTDVLSDKQLGLTQK